MPEIHVLHTPMHEHSRKDAGIHWCFACRKHLQHALVLMVCDDPESYYGPHWKAECSQCKKDRTRFPEGPSGKVRRAYLRGPKGAT